MSDVYITGIEMIPFGRYPHRTPASLGAEAVLGALDDAGITVHDVQTAYCGCVFQTMVGQKIFQQIGQTGIPVANVSNACATGATAVREAWMAVRTGDYDIALAVGVEQMTGMGMLGSARQASIPIEGLMGSTSMPATFAEAGREYAAKYGTSFAQFAKVSVKNHHHATMNPKAVLRKETPLEMVMEAEMIAYPNTKLMCSINVDGAAAVILMSEKKVRELGLMDRAIRIRASALASDPWQQRNPQMPDINSATQIAAQRAYEMAGIEAKDLDLVELHDCFATAELLHYENLQLCGAGEANDMIDSGATALGGRIPVNVSGGLLSKGHPIGATGVANLYELSLHLRRQAGERQVEGARMGLAHVVGLGTCSAVHILEKA
ncbi:thiolase family protein [Sphingopyxis macrogoltabida]|uniref:propanoyl-CoA C-acyltransferase n=1 Tax=Sphingopyxis macrogoltabida TaxID=33050 RepID=A0AAC9AZK7_SPHMC|nr:thiolase family protein [Sphingopyxis macrogoltabida]ALJ16451.1 thiolase [Sphingopyxis macrogoltabida]AMU92687.1 thiolase [Sphingopyxis macrogoltabida]